MGRSPSATSVSSWRSSRSSSTTSTRRSCPELRRRPAPRHALLLLPEAGPPRRPDLPPLLPRQEGAPDVAASPRPPPRRRRVPRPPPRRPVVAAGRSGWTPSSSPLRPRSSRPPRMASSARSSRARATSSGQGQPLLRLESPASTADFGVASRPAARALPTTRAGASAPETPGTSIGLRGRQRRRRPRVSPVTRRARRRLDRAEPDRGATPDGTAGGSRGRWVTAGTPLSGPSATRGSSTATFPVSERLLTRPRGWQRRSRCSSAGGRSRSSAARSSRSPPPRSRLRPTRPQALRPSEMPGRIVAWRVFDNPNGSLKPGFVGAGQDPGTAEFAPSARACRVLYRWFRQSSGEPRNAERPGRTGALVIPIGLAESSVDVVRRPGRQGARGGGDAASRAGGRASVRRRAASWRRACVAARVSWPRA